MINDLKELEKLLKLLRKQGILTLKWGDLDLKLGDLPQTGSISIEENDPTPANKYANFPQGELTPEQLMFYSSGGLPEDDPLNRDIQPQ